MHTLKKGILISIEGIDGSGKSTLAKKLYHSFKRRNLPTLLTFEFGATALGKQLRTILHKRDFPLCAKAEYFLIAADRAQHFDEIIIPFLRKKTVIISDRMGDSSLAYQGYGRGLDCAMIQKINRWAMHGIQPNLTIYIKLSIDEARKRIKQRKEALTIFEKEKEIFMQKVIKGYDAIFKKRKNVIVLDGTQRPDVLASQAMRSINSWMKKNNLLP